VTQVSALLGCSAAHVYDLCERSQLPHYRDLQNAIRFDCEALAESLGLGQQRTTATRSGDA
jgi:predicted DNA-binding transcriptional regulator AlpA